MEDTSLSAQMAALPANVKQTMGEVAENFRKEGRLKGISAGRKRGRSYRTHQVACNMIQKGYSSAEICVVLKVTNDYVLSISSIVLESHNTKIEEKKAYREKR